MAIVFKKLARGSWKNRETPLINNQYSHLTSEEGCKNFQAKLRQSSVDSSKYYSYESALSVANKISFGVNGTAAYDFHDYAKMPFKQANTVTYHGRQRDINCQLTPVLDNNDKIFSPFASKYSSLTGIFYSNQQPPISIQNCSWEGISVADKNCIPALLQVDQSTKEKSAGMIMVKSFKLLSAAEDRTITIDQQKITDGSDSYRFDPDNDSTRIKFIYIISQAPGGNGGKAYNSQPRTSSGSGGGAGGYSIDLVRIPDSGSLSIWIPATPQKSNESILDDYMPSYIRITHSDGTILREVKCGGWGKSAYVHRAGWWDALGSFYRYPDGGKGGYVVEDSAYPLNINNGQTFIQNIIKVTGAKGASASDRDTSSSSGASPEIIINDTKIDTVASDGKITIPSVPGITQHWPSIFNNDKLPGAGASSSLGRGGDFVAHEDGLSGDGPGAGGGGGSKSNDYIARKGGAGCGAAIYIGF